MDSIIIEIIRQDMRFIQYINALRLLGIEVYGFQLDLMDIVANLMALDNSKIDAWRDLYIDFLYKTINYEREPLGNNLSGLAEKCYNALDQFKVKKC